MIVGWKIWKVKDDSFDIIANVEEDELWTPQVWDFSFEEWGILKYWGFLNAEEDRVMNIYKMRQVDMLEADFPHTDTSEISKKSIENEISLVRTSRLENNDSSLENYRNY